MLTREGLAPYQGVVFANTTGHAADSGSCRSFSPGLQAARRSSVSTAPRTRITINLVISACSAASSSRMERSSRRKCEWTMPRTHRCRTWRRPSGSATSSIGSRRWRAIAGPCCLWPATPATAVRAVGDGQPLAWHRSHSAGRVFYTALGHRSELWQDPRYRRHVLEGIRWTLSKVGRLSRGASAPRGIVVLERVVV